MRLDFINKINKTNNITINTWAGDTTETHLLQLGNQTLNTSATVDTFQTLYVQGELTSDGLTNFKVYKIKKDGTHILHKNIDEQLTFTQDFRIYFFPASNTKLNERTGINKLKSTLPKSLEKNWAFKLKIQGSVTGLNKNEYITDFISDILDVFTLHINQYEDLTNMDDIVKKHIDYKNIDINDIIKKTYNDIINNESVLSNMNLLKKEYTTKGFNKMFSRIEELLNLINCPKENIINFIDILKKEATYIYRKGLYLEKALEEFILRINNNINEMFNNLLNNYSNDISKINDNSSLPTDMLMTINGNLIDNINSGGIECGDLNYYSINLPYNLKNASCSFSIYKKV